MEQFDYGRPNLQKERLDELDTGYDNSERRKSVDVAKSRVKSRDWTSIIHFVVLYSLLVYFLVTNNPHLHSIISGPIASTSPVDVLSPAQNAVQYEKVQFEKHFLNRSPWTWPPTEELDGRWTSLYDFGICGISAKEAAQLEEPTAKIPHTDSYAITLEVFHQLHCLDHLRKTLYPDEYPDLWEYNPDGTVNRTTFAAFHSDHCIDTLRQTLICHGDITPVPFAYLAKDDRVYPTMKSTHMCRDYGKIQEWARSHQSKVNDKRYMYDGDK